MYHILTIDQFCNAVIRGVLALCALAFSLLFGGAWLWSRDRNIDRWCGLLLILIGALIYGMTGLWLFGWL